MASTHQILLFFFLLLVYISNAQTSFKPRTVVLPIQRDTNTNLYVTSIHKRTPQVPLPFVIDLNGRFLSVNCQNNYLSSTYRAPNCPSSLCKRVNNNACRGCFSPAAPGCHNDTCSLVSVNPITGKIAPGELAVDTLSVPSIDGQVVTVPKFLFACAPAFLLDGKVPLPAGVQGFAGFGRTQIALPTQFTSNFGFQHKFGLCLGRQGVVFIGNGPYTLQPGIDVSKELTYTPLIINGEGEYFINVNSIKINNKNVPINTSLLRRGTKISTVVPYTVLESSIYTAVTEFYAHELSSVPKVAPVAPFELCFNTKPTGVSRDLSSVPFVDLVLENNKYWRMFSDNLVVYPANNVACLAFVNGGEHPVAPIVIGAHQMEDHLLQFDLSKSRLGFSSSLLLRLTQCANFNFTSNV